MYKNNLNCRACGHLEESQDHILNQCHKIHTTDQSKIKPEEYFEDDPEFLKKAAYKIETIMTLLESYITTQVSNQNTRRTRPIRLVEALHQHSRVMVERLPSNLGDTVEEEEEYRTTLTDVGH